VSFLVTKRPGPGRLLHGIPADCARPTTWTTRSPTRARPRSPRPSTWSGTAAAAGTAAAQASPGPLPRARPQIPRDGWRQTLTPGRRYCNARDLPDHLRAGVHEGSCRPRPSTSRGRPRSYSSPCKMLALNFRHELVDVAAHVVEVDLVLSMTPSGDHEVARRARPSSRRRREHPGDLPGGVGGHGVPDVRGLLLALLPGQVDELGSVAHGHDVAPHLHERSCCSAEQRTRSLKRR